VDTLLLDPRQELTEENFDKAYEALKGQYDKAVFAPPLPALKLAGDSSPGIVSGFSGNGKIYLTVNEDKELNHHLPLPRNGHLAASALEAIASAFFPVPDAHLNGHFRGIGASSKVGGGEKLAAAAKSLAAAIHLGATWEQVQAGITSRYASYEPSRRLDAPAQLGGA
jgi:hypothetical protein